MNAKEAHMNAQEARVRAQIAFNVRIDNELQKVRQHIENAVSKGLFIINVNNVSNDAAVKLKGEGYTVKTTYDQRDGNFTTISW